MTDRARALQDRGRDGPGHASRSGMCRWHRRSTGSAALCRNSGSPSAGVVRQAAGRVDDMLDRGRDLASLSRGYLACHPPGFRRPVVGRRDDRRLHGCTRDSSRRCRPAFPATRSADPRLPRQRAALRLIGLQPRHPRPADAYRPADRRRCLRHRCRDPAPRIRRPLHLRLAPCLHVPSAPAPPWQAPAVFCLGGHCGAVSLAAALALPSGLANRDLIVFLTFAVILVMLAARD